MRGVVAGRRVGFCAGLVPASDFPEGEPDSEGKPIEFSLPVSSPDHDERNRRDGIAAARNDWSLYIASGIASLFVVEWLHWSCSKLERISPVRLLPLPVAADGDTGLER